ncbi:cytochrome P460 family protein [Flavitalea flava]
MKENDFVFTIPLDLSEKTKKEKSPPVNLFEWKVINTSVNKRDQTMSTLYGNDLAVSAARAGTTVAYPPGSVLSLVTWFQKADKHYFGANIPAAIKSIEEIHVANVVSQKPSVMP